jgi:hypothetical protein
LGAKVSETIKVQRLNSEIGLVEIRDSLRVYPRSQNATFRALFLGNRDPIFFGGTGLCETNFPLKLPPSDELMGGDGSSDPREKVLRTKLTWSLKSDLGKVKVKNYFGICIPLSSSFSCYRKSPFLNMIQ